MEELKSCTTFPPKTAFFSKLKQADVDDQTYADAKIMYETKIATSEWKNMSDYLRHYNMLDVVPLVEALKSCFHNYAKFFDVDACSKLSLPSIGFNAKIAFENYALDPKILV